MNHIFHPHAERELEESEAHYDRIGNDLGDRFRSEIEQAISRISMYPFGWQALSSSIRRCRLESFPYGLVYRITPNAIRILCVMHNHREPGYWKDRS